MRQPDITIRGTRHPNALEAIQHLSVSGDDYAISVGGMYLSVKKAEAERLERPGSSPGWSAGPIASPPFWEVER